MKLLTFLLLVLYFGIIVTATSSYASKLRTMWKGNNREPSNYDSDIVKALPSHCELAVVGAGWGGVYFAWRLGIELMAIDPSNICVFEVNGRLGGRIYSVSGLPNMSDLVIDVGGYRFPAHHLLPAQLVWDKLMLPTSLYGVCIDDILCYKIADIYGNNAGYTIPIEEMLGELMTRGTQVYWGAALTSIESTSEPNSSSTLLKFNDLNSNSVVQVHADTTLLNMDSNSLNNLDPKSVIFNDATKETVSYLKSTSYILGVKVYANYENAWWYNDLGLMTGDYKDNDTPAPLNGRYNDGPTKCITGYGADGSPIYSGNPVAFGNCSGALLVLYTNTLFRNQEYYTKLMTSLTNPLTVISQDSENANVLDEIHESLMEFHAEKLEEAGIDPKSVSKPLNIFIGNWVSFY